MSEPRWTPGPWRRGIGNEYRTVFSPQGSIICNDCGAWDGHLIASAPALCAALEAARACPVDVNGDLIVTAGVAAQIDAAMAAARGESNG